MDLERRVTKNTRNIKTIGEAIQLLTVLTSSHTDQLERTLFGIDELRGSVLELRGGISELRGSVSELRGSVSDLRDGQREMQEKMNALIDAQIRNEDEFQRFRKETQENFSEMAKSMTAANLRIERLEQN
ncbi:MAG: hypothetical protein R2681_00095 [Pyrinomonadaceae bacterium]